MTYVDGYVIPVPTKNKELYIEQARTMAEVFKEHGVIEIYENWGDDVPQGKVNSFYTAVMCEESETVVFSWAIWPSKEIRDKGWQAVMEDPRMKPDPDMPMPFDGKRLIYGGFETVIRQA
ncbi:MAG: DUF1428 domain-containing protein [Kangiellaceae bacterium]|jgi:uncharacterized protein YbaA (DUF1428 family)|nr:DUF1428 domain-containing protein [Kangiellaceae bacterium]